MKKTVRLLAVILVAALSILALASCGGTATPADPSNTDPANTEPSNNTVKGTTGEHGYYKVLVPEGYTLKHEDLFGDNKPGKFNINSDSSSFTYFMFGMYDSAEEAQSNVDTTKDINEADDVTVEIGGKTWKGCAYDASGIPCYSIFAEFDGHFVLVTAAGNAYNSEITSAVLSSLEVNVTEE